MWHDDPLLVDMLVAARHARDHVSALSPDQFMASKLHQDAVIRELEVLGEAARRVSEQARAGSPEIPWSQIVGLRNRLIHEYFRVRLGLVWEVVTTELPPLIERLEEIVPSEGNEA
jgi:uncharacterized protein with HEPN domain